MKKRIILNDQGIYVDCIIENDRISFEFENGLEALNNKVDLFIEDGITYGLLGIKKFVKIFQNEISKVNDITTTEIRVLCSIANRINYLMEANKEGNFSLLSEFNRLFEEVNTLPKFWNDEQVHHSELHTHFSLILNTKEFIDFINQYNVTYPFNDNGELDFKEGKELTYKELLNEGLEEKLINALRVDITNQSSFNDGLIRANNNRQELLHRISKNNSFEVMKNHEIEEYIKLEKEIIDKNNQLLELDLNKDKLSSKEYKKKKGKISKEIHDLLNKKMHIINNVLYDDLLKKSLVKLNNEKVYYSEISFSNHHRLEYFSEIYKNDDSFKLLYSIRIL